MYHINRNNNNSNLTTLRKKNQGPPNSFIIIIAIVKSKVNYKLIKVEFSILYIRIIIVNINFQNNKIS